MKFFYVYSQNTNTGHKNYFLDFAGLRLEYTETQAKQEIALKRKQNKAVKYGFEPIQD